MSVTDCIACVLPALRHPIQSGLDAMDAQHTKTAIRYSVHLI